MTARLVGINHVALEVDDIEQALEFYGSLFEISLRGRGPSMAFIDMGDRSSRSHAGAASPPTGPALRARRGRPRGRARRVARARRRGRLEGSVDFLDPWGNHIRVVDYRDIQFSKTARALRPVGGERLVERCRARRNGREGPAGRAPLAGALPASPSGSRSSPGCCCARGPSLGPVAAATRQHPSRLRQRQLERLERGLTRRGLRAAWRRPRFVGVERHCQGTCPYRGIQLGATCPSSMPGWNDVARDARPCACGSVACE